MGDTNEGNDRAESASGAANFETLIRPSGKNGLLRQDSFLRPRRRTARTRAPDGCADCTDLNQLGPQTDPSPHSSLPCSVRQLSTTTPPSQAHPLGAHNLYGHYS